ncbi:site-2 protease family protein [Candidatus Woesearchaeota archaeon]|nr:site-2 protease family protein [Candidatus Woesearchaeota archaeon]
MDSQIIAAIIFFLLMGLFLLVQRRKVQLQKILFPALYFVLYRTKVGLNLMNSMAKKHPKIIKGFAYAGVVLGFFGMIFISFALMKNIYQLFVTPAAAPGVGLVLPFKVKGAFYVPFFYWILSIFIIATVHEFSHGVVARAYNLKIKSSGLAFLGIFVPVIPAAFVEPDEKKIVKRPRREQLSVFAAGPFSNVVLGILFLLVLIFLGAPLIQAVLDFNGVRINDFIRDNNNMTLPAEDAGMSKGEIVREMDGIEINYLYNFSRILQNKTPGDAVFIVTDKGSYNVTLTHNPDNGNSSYLGVYVQQNSEMDEAFVGRYGMATAKVILWFTGSPGRYGLLFWLYVLNFGIGLFNLVPVGPLDGGRMLNLALGKFLKKEKAQKIFTYISLFFLSLILINIISAFVR